MCHFIQKYLRQKRFDFKAQTSQIKTVYDFLEVIHKFLRTVDEDNFMYNPLFNTLENN